MKSKRMPSPLAAVFIRRKTGPLLPGFFLGFLLVAMLTGSLDVMAIENGAGSAPVATVPAVPAAAGTDPVTEKDPATETDRLVFSQAAYCGPDQAHARECRLGDTLFIGFANLRQWMGVSSNHVSGVALVLNGRVMTGLTSRGPDGDYRGLQFDLKRLDGDAPEAKDNRDAWNAIVGELRTDPNLRIGVASGGNPPFWGAASVRFQIFPNYTWAVLVFLVLLLILFFVLARKSDILRDTPSIAGQPRSSYSLARCQMAWWFFIIAASYNYIWLVLSNHESLTTGSLILTGISAGTGLASAVIDSNKNGQRQSLESEQALIGSQLAALPAAIASAGDATEAIALRAAQLQKVARLTEVQNALQRLPSPIGASEGFFVDILRDETGISFHRFQMAAWTVILGFVFVTSVYRNLIMPDFSATLLGLMGISSGTYIGFKISDPAKGSGSS